ncbi:MAG: class I SAM-dependent methyltransferase [Beijerinckiaceae bacterium]|nr:class I SAM-dependent methyltransferase [Beijerinckiaceae bacterium]
MDYGCGFGRFAALHLSKGTPQQLDLVDAWARAIDFIKQGNFKNRCWCVSEMLKDLDIPANSYDLIISFSAFTHLSENAFLHNLERLYWGLKSNGRIYLTVRHDDFVPVKFRDTADAVVKALDQRGIYWQQTPNKFETEPVFGTTLVTPAFMEELGKRFGLSRRLQSQVNYQHMWVITKPENTR